VSRRGSGPAHPQIERIGAGGTNAARLTELAKGAGCAVQLRDAGVPPVAAAGRRDADRRATGADYIMLGNTYGYGRSTGR
jgi:hypothetical protein